MQSLLFRHDENGNGYRSKKSLRCRGGDWGELELQENAFFNAVIVMYGLPFIGFIVGIVLGYFGVPKLIPNISPVLPSLVLGVLGIVLAMLWIHSQNHRWESGKYRPLATKIVEEDEPEMCGA